MKIVNSLKKLNSIIDLYLEKEKPLKPTCPECGGALIFEGGCNTCKDCGYSKCD